MSWRGVRNALCVGLLITIVVLVAVAVAPGRRGNGGRSCGGHGRPSLVVVPIVWSQRLVQISAASPTGDITSSFSVSQLIDLPSGAKGLRVETQVFGSRNAPIFPDPVRIDVAPDEGLGSTLRAVAEAWMLPSATGNVPFSSVSPADRLMNVGVGIKAINEFVALGPGRYRLVSSGPLSSLGEGSFRVCA